METKETKTQLTADELAMVLFNKLQEKKAEVANAERPVYITGGNFRFSESTGATYEIPTLRDIRKVKEILAFLIGASERDTKAGEMLGIVTPFTWFGFTFEEWLADLKTRASVLELTKRRTELAELEKRVNAVMSKELLQKMEMEKLQRELGVE